MQDPLADDRADQQVTLLARLVDHERARPEPQHPAKAGRIGGIGMDQGERGIAAVMQARQDRQRRDRGLPEQEHAGRGERPRRWIGPAGGFQAVRELGRATCPLQQQRLAGLAAELDPPRRQGLPAIGQPLAGRQHGLGRLRRIGRERSVVAAHDMPAAGDHQGCADQCGQGPAPDPLLVEMAEQEGEGRDHGDPEQQPTQHVRGPVRRQIDPREADQDDVDHGQRIDQRPRPARLVARDQDREDAVEHRVQGGMAAREAQAVDIDIEQLDRAGARQDHGQERHEQGGARDRDQEAQAAAPGAPPEQPEDRDAGDRRGHHAIAEQGHEHHQPIGPGSPQGGEEIAERGVGQRHRIVRRQAGNQPQEGGHRDHQHQRRRQHAGRARGLRIEGGGQPLRHPVRPAAQPGDHGFMGPGIERHQDQDQPARQHDRDHQDQQEAAQDHGQPAADGAQGAERRTGQDARPEMDQGPDDRRDHVDDGEAGRIHADHAGDARHHCLDARHEPADEHALGAMGAEVGLAAGNQLAIAVERPALPQRLVIDPADPVGDRVAGDGAQHGPDEDRPKAELAEADQGAGGHQHGRAGHDHADDEQGLAHGDDEDDQPGQLGMSGQVIDQRLDDVRHRSRPGCLLRPVV